jgi:tetratricopeptide (TPR) repeat protein
MEQDKKAVNDSDENAGSVKKDTNARRTDEASQKASWHNYVSIIIAILALLLSFGTTYFSSERIKEQDLQNTKVELRELLQRLSALPKEFAEITNKSLDDSNVAGAVYGSVANENALLSRQAEELARKLPRHQVSAAEWLTIGTALGANHEYNKAREILGYALEDAKDFYIEVVILRATAHLLFDMGKAGEGRSLYHKALDIFSKYPGYDERIQNEMTLNTYMYMAGAEAEIDNKADANQYLAKARSYLDRLPRGPERESFEGWFNEMKAHVNSEGDKKEPPVTDVSNKDGGGPLGEVLERLQRIEAVLSARPPMVPPRAQREVGRGNKRNQPIRNRPPVRRRSR